MASTNPVVANMVKLAQDAAAHDGHVLGDFRPGQGVSAAARCKCGGLFEITLSVGGTPSLVMPLTRCPLAK
jgi:hypothetical protein